MNVIKNLDVVINLIVNLINLILILLTITRVNRKIRINLIQYTDCL